MKVNAKFSTCGQYRYTWWRTWDEAKPYAMIIGLNPTVADDVTANPTLVRCIRFAKAWGYGGVCVVNLFAYLAATPSDLMKAPEPIGKENDEWLMKLAQSAGVVVAAWGNSGGFMNRSDKVKKKIKNLHCLKVNQSGEPAHPLYLKADLMPMPYVSG